METHHLENSINGEKLISNPLDKPVDNTNGSNTEQIKKLFQGLGVPLLDDILSIINGTAGKQSFLVFKNNKYLNISTENIAFFYIKHESPMIMCFDRQEYFVNHSLEQIQKLILPKQFYRLNRQYLINFSAIKEVEHYFARKLLVIPLIPSRDKLIVPKEKVTGFLQWLDNR